MREDLIAYALGELEGPERERLQQALAENEALQQELAQICECLGDEDCDAYELEDAPPSDLAERTTAGIFAGGWHDDDHAVEPVSGHGHSLLGFASPMDMTVAIGVLVTVASMLMPAIYGSRNHAQRVSCEHNLGQLGQLLELYAQENRGFYPVVRPTEHAGIFAPRLREADFVRPDQLDQLLLCSSSPLAEQLAYEERDFHVPSMAELSLAKGMWRLQLQRMSSGSYGYQVGYVKGGYYLPVKNHNNSMVPVMSDTASITANHRVTANHDGNVINVLMQDGSVPSLSAPWVPCSNDHLYFNRDGQPVAGMQWNDAVVLPSGETPGVERQPMPEAVYRIFFRVR